MIDEFRGLSMEQMSAEQLLKLLKGMKANEETIRFVEARIIDEIVARATLELGMGARRHLGQQRQGRNWEWL